MSLDAVSTTEPFCKPLYDYEPNLHDYEPNLMIHIIQYYPQTSFSLISKKFDELWQIAVFLSRRRVLSFYQDRSQYINESVCIIEDSYSLSRRIGDYNYQEANEIMLYVMKNIFRSLDSLGFARKIITSPDNIEKFIEIENQALTMLFEEPENRLFFLRKNLRFNDPRIIKIWMHNEENQKYLQNIDELKLYHKKLIVIPQEIKIFKALSKLYLVGDQINYISPIAELTTLTYLDLSQNQIRDISPIARLTALTHLFLSWNQICDISPLKGLTTLTELHLSQNQISDISPIARLTALTHLEIYYNQIFDIRSLRRLTGLTYLDLTNTQISDVSPIVELTALTELLLSHNQIRDISPIARLTTLTYLDLSKNLIRDISSIAELTALTHLDLSWNQISDISPLRGLTTLTELDLCYNQISDLIPIYELTRSPDFSCYCSGNPETEFPIILKVMDNCCSFL